MHYIKAICVICDYNFQEPVEFYKARRQLAVVYLLD